MNRTRPVARLASRVSAATSSSSSLSSSTSSARARSISTTVTNRQEAPPRASSPAGPPHPPSSTGAFSSSPSSHDSSLSSPSNPSIGPLRVIHPPSHLASYFFPTPLRPHYLALQSFFLELALIPSTVSSEILARIRYGWWREALQACYDARNASVDFARGEVGTAAKRYKHPIVVELERAIWNPLVRQNGGLVQDHFEAIIDAWENALATPSAPPSLDALEASSERIYSRQLYLHLNLLGVSSGPIDEIFSHLGKAMGILESVLDTPTRMGVKLNPATPDGQPARVAKNRKPSLQETSRGLSLPAEYLQQHNVVEETIHRQGGAAPGFKDAIFATATRANDYLITARTTAKKELKGGKLPPAARPALVNTAVVPFVLNRLEAYDFDPFVPAFRFEAKGQGWRLPWLMYKTSWTGRV